MKDKEQQNVGEPERGISELFFAVPQLKKSFLNMENRIKYFRKQPKRDTTKEDLERKMELLLQTAKTLNGRDIRIIYYIRNIDSLGERKMLEMLEKLYQAEEKFKAEWNGENEWKDPLQVGAVEWLPIEL
ncbi:MAG: hypothetical protein IJX75_03070 [Clostridia bacterium]|nr:hypothetical protein [Clostridia bacterium]